MLFDILTLESVKCAFMGAIGAIIGSFIAQYIVSRMDFGYAIDHNLGNEESKHSKIE